jgi:uncharacterized membrane protein
MSPIQMTALAVRLFAIWLGIYWLGRFPYLYNETRHVMGFQATALPIVVMTFGVIVALVLWFFPRTVARALLPGDDPPPTVSSPAPWFTIGCVLLGLWVLSDAVPGMAERLFIFWEAKRQDIAIDGWEGILLYFVVKLVIAVWLLLGAAGMRKILWWARNARFGE